MRKQNGQSHGNVQMCHKAVAQFSKLSLGYAAGWRMSFMQGLQSKQLVWSPAVIGDGNMGAEGNGGGCLYWLQALGLGPNSPLL